MGERKLYVGMHDGICTLTSADGAWMKGDATPLNHAVARLAVGDPRRAYLAAYESGVWRTDDGGRSWVPLSSYPSKYAHSVAVHPQNSELLYVGAEPAALFRSQDGGQSWEECSSFLDHHGAQEWYFHGDRAAHVRDLQFSEQDPNRLYAGIEVGGAVRSLDGGQTWKQLQGLHPDVHSLHLGWGGSETVYAATAGGPFRSGDGGETWELLTPGLEHHYTIPVTASPNNPEVVLVAVATSFQRQDAQAYRSDDGGRRWQRLILGSEDDMVVAYAWDRDDRRTVYAGTDGGTLYISHDQGITWESIAVDLPTIAVGALAAVPVA